MACFGCYRQHSVAQDFDQDLGLKKLKKKKSWISWSRPKKSVAKTVSISVSMPVNLDASSKSHLFKLDEVDVVPSKKHRRHSGVNAGSKAYKNKSGTVKEIILENSEINHLTWSAREDKHDKKHSGTKKEPNKNGSNSAPENKATNGADNTSVPPHREKKTESINVVNGVGVKNQNKEALDSKVGMSIIVVILVFILIWGKLCAILCTAAWFYMIPRLRTAVDSSVVANNNALESDVLNLNSDQHKKKVVLEGLLHRDHRSVIGLL